MKAYYSFQFKVTITMKKRFYPIILIAIFFSTICRSQNSFTIDLMGSTDTTGFLYDQGGPTSNYPDNSSTFFTISPSNGKIVNIQFREFDIEPGETDLLPGAAQLCEYDQVNVYDGADNTATLLGTFCGRGVLPDDMQSSGGDLTIEIISDGGTNGTGFEIFWTTDELPSFRLNGYCSASGFDCDPVNGPIDEELFIERASLTTINNTSSCSPNGFTDYSNQIAVIPAGQGSAAQLSVYLGGPGPIPTFVYAWVDMNQDTIFSSDERIVLSGETGAEFFAGAPYTALIQAPDQAIGLTRMRIRATAGVPAAGLYDDACGGNGEGEVEDYNIFFGDTTVNNGNTYCSASGANDCMVNVTINGTPTTQEDYISMVTLGNDGADIVNTTMCDGGYGDYSNIVAPVTPGLNYSIVFERERPSLNFMANAWIDFNNNLVFDDEEALVVINDQANGNSYLANYVVSPTQPNGIYRLRIRLSNNIPAEPCGMGTYEVEDYSILVGTPLECISNPMPTDASQNVCTRNNIFSWDEVADATGYRFSLFYDDGTNNVTVIKDLELDTNTYTAPGNFVPNATYTWIAIPFNDSQRAFGCDTLSFTTPNANPTVDIAQDTIQICNGTAVDITANVVDGNAPLNFTWTGDTGNLNNTNSQTVTFTATVVGTFNLNIDVNDEFSCSSNTDSVVVQVSTGSDKGNFVIADTNACFGAPIQVDWNNFFGATTIEVSNDNVSFTTAANVDVNGNVFNVFQAPGTYFLRGIVDAGGMCKDTTESIAVLYRVSQTMPLISFAGPSEVCAGESSMVQIDNYSTGIVWNNDASLTSNPLTISTSGNYFATVTDALTGCSINSDTLAFNVLPALNKPNIEFVNQVASICEGDTTQVRIKNYSSGIVWNSNPALTDNPLTVSVAGNYSAVVTDQTTGCSVSSDTLELKVNSLPTTKPTIAYSETVLTASPTSASYQWYFNGTKINGETNKTLVHNKVEGTYTVELLSAEGCASPMSDDYVLSTVGITNNTQTVLQLYPNPNKGNFTIQFGKSVASGEISISDISGKKVVNKIVNNKSAIELSGLKAGIYIVKSNLDGKVYNQKMIVE